MKNIKHLAIAIGALVALTAPLQTKASLLFNGTNSKAVLDGNYLDGLNHSNYTFEVWIKPFAYTSGHIFGKSEYWKEWSLAFTGPTRGLIFGGAWPSYYWGSEAATNSITTNVWQHICCAVSNGVATFYVNGLQAGTENVQNPISFRASADAPWLDAVMFIGYADSGTTPDYNYFNGLIYGIKVWSRTLSASEVSAIVTTGVPPSTNGLYNAVMLDEVSGSTLEDSRTALAGRVLTALRSSDTPPMSQADLSFTNSTPIASCFIDLSHYNDYKTPILSSQSNYCFRATGRGGVGPLDRGDAMADAAFYPSFHPLTAKWAAPANTWTWVDRMPFRPTPDVFNPNHVYYFYFQGRDTYEELLFQDNPYSDNVGGFNVDLFLVSPQNSFTNGLVAYYPFNGNANDASGNGKHGHITGNVVPATDRFGNASAAYRLDGALGSIDVTNTVFNIGQTEYTISGWFCSDDVTKNEQAVFNTIPHTGIALELNNRNTPGRIFYGIGPANAFWTVINASGVKSDYTNQVWYHLAFTKSGTSYVLYINGQIDAQRAVSAASGYDYNVGYRFGAIDTIGDEVFKGRLDGFRIYNRALSTNEVQQLYAYESTPVTPSPSITSQPVNQTVNQGNPASFSVTATGTGLGFQWRLNTVSISGATNASYNIASATTNHAGTYAVIVSNAGGSVTSSNAVLTVIPPPRTGTGTATLFDVFVVAVNITDGGSGYTNPPLVRLIGGGGSGAQAVAVVSNGVITAITMRNAGYYTSTPLVVIDPPFILNPVLDIAPMSFLTFSNLTVGGVYQLQRSVAWYWTNEPVSFTAAEVTYTEMVAGLASSGDYRLALNPVPAQAFATAQVVNGFCVGAMVTSGGSGYVTSPAVSIVGGGGTNATAVSYTSGGVVTSIGITSAGIGYTNTPTVEIEQPPAAAVSPTVLPVMRVDAARLAPYNNYQIQFKPALGGPWQNWADGLFAPTDVTSSQYLFITNSAGFVRLQHVP